MQKKSIINFLIRIIISFAILYILSKSIDLEESLELILKADGFWILLSVIIILFLRFILTLRWKVVLSYLNIFYPFGKLFKINYMATSIGQVLPGGVGGDLIRGYQLNKEINQLVNTTSSILFDRMIGIISMVVLALFSLGIAELSGFSLEISNIILVFCLIFLGGLFLIPFVKNFLQKSVVFKSDKLKRKLEKIIKVLDFTTNKNQLIQLFPKIFGMSMLVQIFRVILFYCIFTSLGIQLDLIYFYIFIPLMLVITILPISIGGLGVREGALIYFFGFLNIRPELCVSAGLIFQLLQILISIPGIFLWILPNRTKNSESNILTNEPKQ